MLRMVPIAVVMVLALLLSIVCCTPSLHPLYTPEDVVFEPALLGRWADTQPNEGEQPEVWEFRDNTDGSYTFQHTDGKGHVGMFTAHLAKLEDKLFLDLYPDSDFVEQQYSSLDYLYAIHQINLHSFLFVAQIEPALKMTYEDDDWIRNYLAEHPDALAHDYTDDGQGNTDDDQLVLTAPTAELQAFLLAHFDDLYDLENLTELVRQAEAPAVPESAPAAAASASPS